MTAAAAVKAPRRIADDQAIQWTGTNLPEVTQFTFRLFRVRQGSAEIYHGLQDCWGPVTAGQWIVKTGPARFRIVDDDAFRAGYELVPAAEAPHLRRWL